MNTGLIVPTHRKQGMVSCAPLALSFFSDYQICNSASEMVPTAFGESSQVSFSGNTLRDATRVCLLGDFKSFQIDNKDEPSHHPIKQTSHMEKKKVPPGAVISTGMICLLKVTRDNNTKSYQC